MVLLEYAVFTKIVNCLFEKCESVNNYGVISNIGTNASASIINSTIEGCKGYGMYVSISSPQIINTIVMDNSQGGIRTNQNELDNPIITYSLIQGRDAINNNLNGNTITPAQVFTNAANGDYTLLSTAPTRNAGNNTAYTGIVEVPNDFGDYDIAHYPRIESNTIDMGAYEYQLLNTPVTGVTVSPQTLTLNVGQSSNDLVASILPANATNQNINWTSSATNKKVTWTSSKPVIATVDNTGKVTALAVGTTTITVKTEDGEKTATCEVTVTAATVAVTGVTLDKNTLSIVEGKTATLVATVAPADATNKKVTWTSSKPAIATVDNTGKITALAVGNTIIAVITEEGSFTATCEVTVTTAATAVTGVTLDNTKLSIVEGKTATLVATVAPANATNKKVTWTSSKPAIATVDNTGKVTALSVGTTTITVKTENGEKTATCEVTVTKGTNVEDVIENLTFFTISPNPASDRLTLSMSANAPAPKTLSIFNAAGKEMFRLNSPASDLTIDVSNFTSGVYFINIDGVSRKFTIER